LTAAEQKNMITRYEELFRTYFVALCCFARKYVPDRDDSKEIVHSVFVNIWEKREEFDFEKPAKSYLFTSVYNRCMNHIRDRRKFVPGNEQLIIEGKNEGIINSDHLEAAELESKIWRIINSLPEKCKEVFVLNRFEGKKYSEIAEDLGISVKTVETQMSKALKTLRDHLTEYIHLYILLLIKNLW
jgi:RNA polymerase sigma-70 factor (ECF subfamily)